ATAKRDLKAGEVLDGEGGYMAWGRLMPASDSLAAGGLPIGLAHKVALKNPVRAGETLRWSDVATDEASEPVRIRREMERRVARTSSGVKTAAEKRMTAKNASGACGRGVILIIGLGFFERGLGWAFPKGFHGRQIATNGTSLYVRVGGHGPAVVLVHGFGDTGDMWAPVAAVLMKDHTVIVPDLRGMGLSAHPDGGYTKKNQANDI